ncbi:MAG: transposase, partial [Bacteroidota bacterium]
MFVANTDHQNEFLGKWERILSPEKLALLKASRDYHFYELIFCNIREEDFSCLYSIKPSAPNSPVNCLVGAQILTKMRNWSHEELMNQLHFNVSVRVALGLKDLDGLPFSARTLYNFNNRLSNYYNRTGENLLEKVFNSLTEEQLKSLKIKTSIQRADSVLINSNIRSYSRLALLVEVLRRVYEILTDAEKEAYQVWFKPYLQGGEKYVYSLKNGEKQVRLEYLAAVYYSVHQNLQSEYGEHSVFQMFQRVYTEHFKEDAQAEDFPITLRPKEELGSNTLQSPDDLEATFRTKRTESYQGFVAMGAETCHPDNELNLITTLATATNNTDDAEILDGQLDQMKERTPDLEECHVDGGFGSEDVDIKAEKHHITIVQTAVKGATPKVPIAVKGNEKDGFTVNCPNPEHPSLIAQKAKKNWMASFDLPICENCPFFDNCPTKSERKYHQGKAILRFKPTEAAKQKRHKALHKIPPERRTLRAG